MQNKKMSTMDKCINDWEEFDPDILSSYLQKLSLESTIPDLKNSLDILEEESLNTDPNINNSNNKTIDDKVLVIKDKLQSEKDEEPTEKPNSEKETTTFISDEEKGSVLESEDISNIEVSNIVKSELPYSSSDSDSDDSDVLLSRGKEKTKRKSSSRKQYERPNRAINVSELNRHSLQFLSSGFIVQNHAVPSSSPAHCVNSSSLLPVECATFTDCLVNSPLNVSSPESGYDTQTSEVFSPSPPNCLPMLPLFSFNPIEEEQELQLITDNILELEESINKIETQQLESSIPGLDDFEYNDYIEQLKLFFKESDGGNLLETIDGEHGLNLGGSESSENEISDFIPLQNLWDGFETDSNLTSTSTNTSVSELESTQPVTNGHQKTFSVSCSPSTSFSSSKPNKRKIDFKLRDIAKHHVRFSENFNNEKYLIEMRKVLEEVRGKKQCIAIEEQTENSKRTNLHNAVLNTNIERIYCIVEIQKKCFDSIQFEINYRDAFEKTALDYAQEMKLPLIVDYLKENLAVKSV